MQSPAPKFALFLLLIPIVLVLSACAAAKPTANPNLIWAIDVSKSEVKDKLETVETVVQYNGTSDEVHHQSPAQGNTYLIMELTISKQGVQAVPFDWTKLLVQDSTGNTYHRIANDTFLEQYKYKPRMTGLEIKLGQNTGWVCYEIPAQAASGKLSLVYTAEGSQQAIEVKK